MAPRDKLNKDPDRTRQKKDMAKKTVAATGANAKKPKPRKPFDLVTEQEKTRRTIHQVQLERAGKTEVEMAEGVSPTGVQRRLDPRTGRAVVVSRPQPATAAPAVPGQTTQVRRLAAPAVTGAPEDRPEAAAPTAAPAAEPAPIRASEEIAMARLKKGLSRRRMRGLFRGPAHLSPDERAEFEAAQMRDEISRDWRVVSRAQQMTESPAQSLEDYNTNFQFLLNQVGPIAAQISDEIQRDYVRNMPPAVRREYEARVANRQARQQAERDAFKERLVKLAGIGAQIDTAEALGRAEGIRKGLAVLGEERGRELARADRAPAELEREKQRREELARLDADLDKKLATARAQADAVKEQELLRQKAAVADETAKLEAEIAITVEAPREERKRKAAVRMEEQTRAAKVETARQREAAVQEARQAAAKKFGKTAAAKAERARRDFSAAESALKAAETALDAASKEFPVERTKVARLTDARNKAALRAQGARAAWDEVLKTPELAESAEALVWKPTTEDEEAGVAAYEELLRERILDTGGKLKAKDIEKLNKAWAAAGGPKDQRPHQPAKVPAAPKGVPRGGTK